MPLPTEYTKADVIAMKHLADLFRRESISLVSIGACDGVMDDPYWRHIQFPSECTVRGHYLEANCELVRVCRKNIDAHTSGIHCHCAAIWTRDEKSRYWYIPANVLLHELPANCQMAIGCGAIGERPPRELSRDWMQPYVKNVPIDCITWKTACDRYQIGKFDCLNIDVEGADVMVARQIDLREHGVLWACVELRHCGQEGERYAQAMRTRYRDDYDIMRGSWDLYFIRKDLPEVTVIEL